MTHDAHRILEDARATLERLADLKPRDLDPLDRQPAHQRPAAPAFDVWAEVDRRINSATAESVLMVARETARALKHERTSSKAELSDEVRSLRLELTALGEAVAELRRALASHDRKNPGEIIDLPSRRGVN